MINIAINVLSLFDGIGCGRLALKRAGIKVEKYYASEIDKGAITIATANHNDIIEIGDITKISYDKNSEILHTENGDYNVGKIDLIIGGSPCTDFSSIGYAKGMVVEQTEISTLTQYITLKNNNVLFSGQSYLFWEYVRLLKEINPQYFLLENVVMSKKWENIISSAIGTSPIKINSALLSAQNRPRLYWTNIPNVTVPNDKGITLESILSNKAPINDVSNCQTVQKCFPKLFHKYGYIPIKFNAYNVSEIKDKACALSRGSMVTSSCATLLFVKCDNGVHSVRNGILNNLYPIKLQDGNYNLRRLSLMEMERLQTLPDNYTNITGVGLQKRSTTIGNGWTVDVIAHILKFLNDIISNIVANDQNQI